MSDEQTPANLETGPPPEEPQVPPQAPPPDEYPFWNYFDLVVFLGLACAGLFGIVLIRSIAVGLHIHFAGGTAATLTAQLILDVFVLGALAALFRLEYNRPFWRSLGWMPARVPVLWLIIAGFMTALAVMFASLLIKVPNTSNPMTQLMEDRTSVILVAIFGITLGPIAEELVFRGFLQPLLVRSMGALVGIFITSLLFGLLHFTEYGNSWAHVVLITGAGASFGVIRHVTGSTKSATIMHAAYNALPFFVLLLQRGYVPHL